MKNVFLKVISSMCFIFTIFHIEMSTFVLSKIKVPSPSGANQTVETCWLTRFKIKSIITLCFIFDPLDLEMLCTLNQKRCSAPLPDTAFLQCLQSTMKKGRLAKHPEHLKLNKN